jgi:hypothetical protein
VRRQRDETWETEARDAAERLRKLLVVLAEHEAALDAGTVEREEFFEALIRVDSSIAAVSQWWTDWVARNSDLKTSRGVALSVVRGCLPSLLGAVDTYGKSLAIFALSPDPEPSDAMLAERGVRAAKEIASSVLEFLDEAPTLRPVDRAAVDASLAGLDARTTAMLALGRSIGSRIGELRSESGPSL